MLDAEPPTEVGEPAERWAVAAVSRKSVSECRKTTPSSITKPPSSHHTV